MDSTHSTEPEQPGGVEQQIGSQLETDDTLSAVDQDDLEAGVEDSPGQTREALQEAAEQAEPR